MDRTDTHRLPYVAADQAQKHVTVNEGLRMLDALVGASARSANRADQPAAPAPGEAYILPAGASGDAWQGLAEHAYAVFQDGAWAAFAPSVGLTVFVEDEGRSRVWDGAAWRAQAGGASDATPRLGVNADADPTNRLVVKSDAVLHSHDDVTPGSGDARHVLNKAQAASTASFLFQTGYGGRAEIGLTGSDDLAVKVSPDGATWHTALTIDRATGAVTMPNTQGTGGSGPDGGEEGGTDPSGGPVGVFVLAGQSNMRGLGDNADGAYAHLPQTVQYRQDGTLGPATTPLNHLQAPASGQVGLDVGFAEAWHAANPGGTLYLIPCAQGATGFRDAEWGVGNPLHEAMVTRAADALASIRQDHASATLTGLLWHQGEDDRTGNTQASYEASVTAMVEDARARLGAPTLPFVLGQMAQPVVTGDGAGIDAAHRALAARLPHAALVSSVGASVQADGVHFDADGYAAMGGRYHAALAVARAAAPGVPGRVEDLAATPGDGQVALAWSAPPAHRSAITDYVVEADGAVFADGVSTATGTTITNLTNGTAYAIRVAAVNDEGQGPWSDAVNAAPAGSGGSTDDGPVTDGAVGFWLLGADNPGMEERGGGRALTLAGAAPVQEDGFVTLATGAPNGLLTDVQEAQAFTAWIVMRPKNTANGNFLGTLGDTTGIGAYTNQSIESIRVFPRDGMHGGDPIDKTPIGEVCFVALAYDASSGIQYLGGSAPTVREKTGTRQVPTHGDPISVGNAYRAASWSQPFDVMEVGVLAGKADRQTLDALYAEAAARQAARGNAVR